MKGQSSKRVLLVDDTATVLAIQKLILGDGYEYLEARNGLEATQIATAERPDLIFMDLNMPVMNGMDALRALKAAPETKDIPVVIVTTHGESAARELCMSLGCAAFATKPIDRARLVALARELLGEADE